MATPKGKPKKISKIEWTCDICEKDKVYPKDKIFKIGDYHEDICAECYDRGLLWSIKESFKWKAQVDVDAKRSGA